MIVFQFDLGFLVVNTLFIVKTFLFLVSISAIISKNHGLMFISEKNKIQGFFSTRTRSRVLLLSSLKLFSIIKVSPPCFVGWQYSL